MACLPLVADDHCLDDAELWDFIDSTVARRTCFKPQSKSLLITPHAIKQPQISEIPPSPEAFKDTSKQARVSRGQIRQVHCKLETSGSSAEKSKNRPFVQSGYNSETAENSWIQPQKIARREERSLGIHDNSNSPYGAARFPMNQIVPHNPNVSLSHRASRAWPENDENRIVNGNNSDWMSSVPSASMFKHIQNAAMSVLEKGDYVMMQGKPFIKKCGWRKIAFFFNISFEIKDRTIQFDQNSNVQRAEFVVRASMQSGRFSDGWGSCDRGEKKFLKANHDIPSTAETRAKTRACQDLLGIGEYKPGSVAW